jgi:hypothetical protein
VRSCVKCASLASGIVGIARRMACDRPVTGNVSRRQDFIAKASGRLINKPTIAPDSSGCIRNETFAAKTPMANRLKKACNIKLVYCRDVSRKQP